MQIDKLIVTGVFVKFFHININKHKSICYDRFLTHKGDYIWN